MTCFEDAVNRNNFYFIILLFIILPFPFLSLFISLIFAIDSTLKTSHTNIRNRMHPPPLKIKNFPQFYEL
jgi:hypothetical protein